MNLDQQLLGIKLRFAAQDRERALQQMKNLRRMIIVNNCMIGLYFVVAIWYSYIAIFDNPWYFLNVAVWVGFSSVFLWNNRNNRRSIVRWQKRHDESVANLDTMTKEYEKYT